jgi:hypothetical protein
MWPPSDHRTERIRVAAALPLDWTNFLRVVRRQRVVGLVHDGLQRVRPNMPAEIAQEISSEAAILMRENLAMAAEAIRLQRLFDKAGIPVLFLKGASLAAVAYGNLGVRSAKDIDLLVSPGMLEPSTEILRRAGYSRFYPPPNISDAQLQLLMRVRKDLCFIHEVTGQQIELHWQLFLNPHIMDEASLVAASRVVRLSGTATLRTLCEEDLFTYLCVHGALHWWNQLKWIADIGALLAAASEGGAERFYRSAKAKGAAAAAAQAMLLCRRLLGTLLPNSLVKELYEIPKVHWLQKTALKAMTVGCGEKQPSEVRFGTTRGTFSAFLLHQGWHYRLAELRNLLFNEADVLMVPLPRQLWLLYPIMRLPLWVFRHARQRDVR